MIQYLIANGQYQKAAKKLKNLCEPTQNSNTFIVVGMPKAVKSSPSLVSAQEQLIHQAQEHFKTLIYSPHHPYQSSCPNMIAADRFEQREAFIRDFLVLDLLDASFKKNIKKIHKNAEKIVTAYTTIQEQVRSKKFHLVALTKDNAALLSTGLCAEAKSILSKTLQKIFVELDEGDVLYYSGMAFIRLLYNDYPLAEQAEQDKRVLDAYQDIKSVYPAMARNLYDSLYKHLREGASISDLSLFGPYAGSHQRVLLEYLSDGRLQKIRRALVKRLEALMENSVTNLHAAKQEWYAHGKMASMLLALPGDSKHEFRAQLNKLTKKAYRLIGTHLFSLCTLNDIESANFVPLFQIKSSILNSAVSIRVLGTTEQIEKLDNLLNRLLAIQRKIMMGLQSSSAIEQFIALSYDIVMLAGSKEQAKHSDSLVHAWHIYISDMANHLVNEGAIQNHEGVYGADVKRRATVDALDDYLSQLDARILGYFLHQFALEKPFIEKANVIRDVLSQAPDLASAKISEQTVCDLLRKAQKPIRWYWHVPKIKDAEQLLIGLMISAKAHLWVEEYKAHLSDASGVAVSPYQLAEMLKLAAMELMQQFGIGHGRFTSHLASAIGAANDYFLPDEKRVASGDK